MSDKKLSRKLWFYYLESTIHGPLDEVELQARLHTIPKKEGLLIWRLGAKNTLRFNEWSAGQNNSASNLSGKSVRIQVAGGLVAGPYEPYEAVDYLREIDSRESAKIQVEGYLNEWTPVQTLAQVVDLLKADTRKYPRLKCDGEVHLSIEDYSGKGRLVDISTGGFRCIGIPGDLKGYSRSTFLGSVKITGVEETIYFQAQIKSHQDNALGFKFLSLDQRFIDLIESYTAFMFRKQAAEAFGAGSRPLDKNKKKAS